MTADEVRAAMGPDMCAVADALRERFGAKLEWLRTDSLELGKPLPPAEPIGEKAYLRQRCRADARAAA